MWAMGRRGEFHRFLDVLLGFAGLGAVGQAADHRADLVDDLGVVQGQRGVRLGVLRLALEGGVQRHPDLPGDPHLQRLGDRQARAVAAQRERVAVVAVGVVGQGLDRGFGQHRGVLVALELFGLVIDQVGGVDAERLDRDRGTDRAELLAGIECGLEVAAVERAPGVLQGLGQRIGIQLGRGLAGGLQQRGGALGVGERLAVAGVQLRPRLLERIAGIGESLGVVRKGGPTGLACHAIAPASN
ncbi:hypothetical protein [Thermomonas sp.]|uniref:hypothetical protein n=1 Tax=Thermomonas sp. TaxID=1971895 RepID=UPI0026361F40|nr:hypothetical protein [Thermomonas sp.]